MVDDNSPQWHENSNGQLVKCPAKIKCRLGGQHFPGATKNEAEAAREKHLLEENSAISDSISIKHRGKSIFPEGMHPGTPSGLSHSTAIKIIENTQDFIEATSEIESPKDGWKTGTGPQGRKAFLLANGFGIELNNGLSWSYYGPKDWDPWQSGMLDKSMGKYPVSTYELNEYFAGRRHSALLQELENQAKKYGENKENAEAFATLDDDHPIAQEIFRQQDEEYSKAMDKEASRNWNQTQEILKKKLPNYKISDRYKFITDDEYEEAENELDEYPSIIDEKTPMEFYSHLREEIGYSHKDAIEIAQLTFQ